MKKIQLFFFFILFFGLSKLLYSQDWDYQKYPKLDITLQHLNADIHIDEFGAIEGDILYRATVNIDDPDSLVFDASRLNIQSVLVNETEREFSAMNNRLVVYLNEVFTEESVLNIRIQYEANPTFGVLRDVDRTTWTSQLPKSTRHWLPVVDHPRVQFTTEFVFTHPSGKMLIANGRRVRSEVVNVDEERTTYASNAQIPATSLAWALGDLSENSSAMVNRLQRNGNQSPIQVHVYSEDELLSELDFADLASGAIQSVRDKVKTSYPYQDLNIVVLENDFWETKSYAAGVVFVYKGHGDIEEQIKRGVVSQWIGSYVREEQWSDAGAIHSAHAILVNQLFDFNLAPRIRYEPYDIFSPYNYSSWENFFDSNDLTRFEASLESSLNNILNDRYNILGWNNLSEIIYNESGQPFFEEFELSTLETVSEDTIEYTAEVAWNEADNTVQVNFNAVTRMVDELVTVSVEEVTFRGTNQHEVTFTGESESSVISISSGVENIKLSIEGRDDIQLNVTKPFMFWINQLRDGMEPEEKVEAAKGLASYTGNPDLQLALDDILRVESNPQVYAAIVRSLSKLTSGAAGMGQRFLEYSSSHQHTEVRIAAVEALADFPNDEQVISRLQNIILQSDNEELKHEALRSLAEVTEPGRFSSIAGNLVAREPVLNQVPFLIQLLAEKGDEESAVEMASTFITDQFPYEVRRDALEIMLKYDRSSANWEERLPDLFLDSHPGIRFKAASGLEFVRSGTRNTLIDQFLQEEYDERIRQVLESYQ